MTHHRGTAQLYELLFDLIVFGLLILFAINQTRWLAVSNLRCALCIWPFWISTFRGCSFLFGLQFAQVISLAILIAVIR